VPKLTRWLVKASLIYLVLALCAGIGMAVPQAAFFAKNFPVYLHLLTFGWLTQLIFGVAWWMFPKYTQAQPRGPVRLGWAGFSLLNAGLALRAIFEPLNAEMPAALFGWMLVAAALLQWLAGLAFVVSLWPRTKEK